MEHRLDTKNRDFPDEATLEVNNIGGIDETTVSFRQGVTVLSGRNATNRTSLLQAIMAALGSNQVSLKADATEGSAALEFGDETYRRTLTRRSGMIVTDGEPYLEDPELADLFAFLLESNEARQAVARGDDLRELIMRPVDTAAIKSEIEQYEQRKRNLDDQLAELDDLEGRLPDLEAKRTRVTDEIETLQAELETAQNKLEETNVDVEERREEQSELEAKLDDVRGTRSEIEHTRNRIETERASIEALEEEQDEVQDKLESLSTGDETEIGRLEAEIETLQAEKADLSEEISQLQSTIQFNEQLLEEPDSFLAETNETDDGPRRTSCSAIRRRSRAGLVGRQLLETRSKRRSNSSELHDRSDSRNAPRSVLTSTIGGRRCRASMKTAPSINRHSDVSSRSPMKSTVEAIESKS